MIKTPFPCTCRTCHYVFAREQHQSRCPRCGDLLRHRHMRSQSYPLIFLLTAIIFYLPANLYPIMVVETMRGTTASTIVGGIIIFFKNKMFFIGSVIFIASVFIPLLKMIGLSYLLFNRNYTLESNRRKTKFYHFIEFIGKWSMIDIFVICIFAGVVNLGAFMRIQSGQGANAFLLVVLFTMLAAKFFDPRLMWDQLQDKSDD